MGETEVKVLTGGLGMMIGYLYSNLDSDDRAIFRSEFESFHLLFEAIDNDTVQELIDSSLSDGQRELIGKIGNELLEASKGRN